QTEPTALDGSEMAPAVADEPGPAASDATFEAALAGVLADFAHDRAATEATAPAPVAEARDAPRFEPREVGEDLYPGLSYALNREAEGLHLATATTPAARPLPPFEPREVGEDLHPGLAHGLH